MGKEVRHALAAAESDEKVVGIIIAGAGRASKKESVLSLRDVARNSSGSVGRISYDFFSVIRQLLRLCITQIAIECQDYSSSSCTRRYQILLKVMGTSWRL